MITAKEALAIFHESETEVDRVLEDLSKQIIKRASDGNRFLVIDNPNLIKYCGKLLNEFGYKSPELTPLGIKVRDHMLKLGYGSTMAISTALGIRPVNLVSA